MKTTRYLLLSMSISMLFSTIHTFSQANPLGLYVDIDGKIKFWEMEANPNGYVDDTVFISYETDTIIDDLRNLKYFHLTFLESPDDYWMYSTCPANDTEENEDYITQYSLSSWVFQLDSAIINYPHNTNLNNIETAAKQFKSPKFTDEIRGAGLTDSVIKILKVKLSDYIENYGGKEEPDGKRQLLYSELSIEDTVINKEAVYDYLVDAVAFYNYTDDKLTSVISYHWNSGVEFDTLRYDKNDNLIYFSRESIGSDIQEFSFKYNREERLEYCGSSHTYFESNPSNDSYLETFKFTYDDKGLVNSKSRLQKNGKWLTSYFKII